jgi:uncharacterized membrane protein YgcG
VLQKLHKSSNFNFKPSKPLAMKLSILLLAFSVILISSCTTAYKTGQTPDDVYFSPSPPQEEYVSTQKNDDRKYQGDDYYEDRYLRMRVQNRSRWSELDDWYNYDRYSIYSYHSYYWTNPWNPYTSWNYYYNPYCHNTVIVNPKNYTYSKPRIVNLNTFNSTMMTSRNTVNPKGSSPTRTNTRVFNNSNNNNNNSNNGLGNTLRNIFNNSSNSSSGTKSSSSGSNSSSSSSSSGSSSSGGSAPVRKF